MSESECCLFGVTLFGELSAPHTFEHYIWHANQVFEQQPFLRLCKVIMLL